MVWVAYTAMWLGTAAAVSVGIYFTGDARCLFALLIPTLVSIRSGANDEPDEVE